MDEHALAAMKCRYGLTRRELQVLEYLARGRSLRYVANELVLSVNTIDTHTKNLYRKLGIHNRQELIDLCEMAQRDSLGGVE